MDYEIMHEADARKYRGLNPEFVHQVWAKRRGGSKPVKEFHVWTDERIAQVEDMLRRGLSSRQIAQAYNVSGGTIRCLVRRVQTLKAIGFARGGK